MAKIQKVITEKDRRKVLEDHSCITDIIELARIIEKNEPRFLSHIKYPSCVTEKLEIFLNITLEEANENYSFEGGDPSDLYKLYDDEKEFYVELASVVGEIKDSDVLDDYDLDAVVEALENASSRYESLAEENYIPDEDDSRDNYGDSGSTTDIAVKVEDIFRDL